MQLLTCFITHAQIVSKIAEDLNSLRPLQQTPAVLMQSVKTLEEELNH